MTTPNWSTMWMQITASQWRAICLRGPAMPLRRGIGTDRHSSIGVSMNTLKIQFYDKELLQ